VPIEDSRDIAGGRQYGRTEQERLIKLTGGRIATTPEGLIAGRLSYPQMDQLRSVDPQALADRAEPRDYSALEDGIVVGRIFEVPVAPEGPPSRHNGDLRRAPMATSRRARLLCRLSPGVGTARREAEEGWG
jgi:hypothetical protein